MITGSVCPLCLWLQQFQILCCHGSELLVLLGLVDTTDICGRHSREERGSLLPYRCGNLTISEPFWLVDMETGVSCGSSDSMRTCGNLTFSDPFWVSNWQMGRPCGLLDFQVDCTENNTTPVLRSSETPMGGFAIVGNVSYKDRTLHVVDLYKLNGSRGSMSNSCHVPRWNTSIKLRPPFRFSQANLNLIFYNCTEAAAVRTDGTLVDMGCGGNGSSKFVRVVDWFPGNEASVFAAYSVEGCDAAVVPVLRASSGETDPRNYREVISGGFLLTWDPPQLCMLVSHL